MWEQCEHLVTWAISAVCRSLCTGNEILPSRHSKHLKWTGMSQRTRPGGVQPTTSQAWKDISFRTCIGYEIGVKATFVLPYSACSSKREPSSLSMIGVPFSTL